MATYSFDGKFTGNILVVGRTGCGKKHLFKNLVPINFLAMK